MPEDPEPSLPATPEGVAWNAALDVITGVEPTIASAIRQELADQRAALKLIASENYASPAVLLTMGNWLSDKYAEGTIGRRMYAGCANVDLIERTATEHARALFGADHAYVQPHSGIDANLVAYWATLAQRVEAPALAAAGARSVDELSDDDWAALRHALGDQRMIGMALDAGGHLTHGFRRNISGKMFDQRSYGTDPETGRLDYSAVRRLARQFRPLIIVAGYSAYPRLVNFAVMREIADEVDATLMVDMAHFAGLVAGGVLTGDNDPVPHAHIVTSTTHKSLRGPRGGLVLCERALAEFVDRGCPLVLGGPLPHVMAAKAVSLAEARRPSFPLVCRGGRGQRAIPGRRVATAWRRPGDRGYRQSPRADRCDQLPRDWPPGGDGLAGRGHRHQPKQRPPGSERSLVHLRDTARHAGADHAGHGYGGDGRDRRHDRRRPDGNLGNGIADGQPLASCLPPRPGGRRAHATEGRRTVGGLPPLSVGRPEVSRAVSRNTKKRRSGAGRRIPARRTRRFCDRTRAGWGRNTHVWD